MTAAFRPVLLSVASCGLKGSLHEFPMQPLDDAGWDHLLLDVRAHRLSGLLASAVESGQLPTTEMQRGQVSDMHVTAMTHALLLENFLIGSVAMFERAGGEVRVLKGSAVAHLDYADPAMRAFVDVDLLVQSEFFDTATEMLRREGHHRYYTEIRPGYDRRFGKGVSFLGPSGLELDLHRTLAMGPFGLTVDLGDLWSSHEEFELGGRTMVGLGREERLLHACYHASLGDWPPRLLPHRDVAEMLLYGKHDEDRLLELARRWGGEAVVARAIATSWRLFDIADVTAMSAWAERYRITRRDNRRLAVYTDGDRSHLAKSLASIGALPRFRDRIALMRMMASPDAAFLSNRDRTRAAWVMESFRRTTRRPDGHH